VEGSDASGDKTVGGNHAGDTELRSRVNATTADSRVGELYLAGKGLKKRGECVILWPLGNSCQLRIVKSWSNSPPGEGQQVALDKSATHCHSISGRRLPVVQHVDGIQIEFFSDDLAMPSHALAEPGAHHRFIAQPVVPDSFRSGTTMAPGSVELIDNPCRGSQVGRCPSSWSATPLGLPPGADL